MEAVHGAVDGHRHVLLAHLVEESGHAGGGDVRGARRHRLAHVADVGAVLVACVLVAQLLEHLAAARVLAPLVAIQYVTDSIQFNALCSNDDTSRFPIRIS